MFTQKLDLELSTDTERTLIICEERDQSTKQLIREETDNSGNIKELLSF